MMGYEALLRLTLIPVVLLFLLSFVSIALTTHYWIAGDWLMPRYYIADASKANYEDYMVDYVSSPTDATIVSASLGLMAGIVAYIAWYKLRPADMDEAHNLSRRRFWIGFQTLTSLTSFICALAALVLHFTQKAGTKDGCTQERYLERSHMYYCTREMATCNVYPGWNAKAKNPNEYRGAINMACNETVAVKWMQLMIMLTALSIIVMFGAQAWLRKKSRHGRFGKEGVEVDRSSL